MKLDYGDLLILALHDLWERVSSDEIGQFDSIVRFSVHAGTEARVIEVYSKAGVRSGLIQAIIDRIKNEGKEEYHA